MLFLLVLNILCFLLIVSSISHEHDGVFVGDGVVGVDVVVGGVDEGVGVVVVVGVGGVVVVGVGVGVGVGIAMFLLF